MLPFGQPSRLVWVLPPLESLPSVPFFEHSSVLDHLPKEREHQPDNGKELEATTQAKAISEVKEETAAKKLLIFTVMLESVLESPLLSITEKRVVMLAPRVAAATKGMTFLISLTLQPIVGTTASRIFRKVKRQRVIMDGM